MGRAVEPVANVGAEIREPGRGEALRQPLEQLGLLPGLVPLEQRLETHELAGEPSILLAEPDQIGEHALDLEVFGEQLRADLGCDQKICCGVEQLLFDREVERQSIGEHAEDAGARLGRGRSRDLHDQRVDLVMLRGEELEGAEGRHVTDEVQHACQERYGPRMQTAARASVPARWWCVVAVATLIVGVGRTSGVEVLAPRELSVAVTPEGFALMEGAPSDRHVVAIDRDGQPMYRRAVPVIVPQARMVGTRSGVAVGWLDRAKVQLARVTGDGQLGEPSRWGKKVQALCEGTASNEHMFAMGWLESDDSAWVVFGPLQQAAVSVPLPPAERATTKTTWCGVTSAGKKIALLTRDNKRRMLMYLCDRKGCAGLPTRIPIHPKQEYAGMTCTADACLVAFRDDQGTHLGWITIQGKIAWSRPLADATPDTTFSLVAAGERAFAVGYATREGATVIRVIQSGSMVRAWADPYSSEPPVLAWASDRLLVAHRHGDNVAPEIVPLPR